jgi:glycosyltransferase involved in cell wall biosynthesis
MAGPTADGMVGSAGHAVVTVTGTVIVVTPGGLEHGGGIGRQMGYFLKANRARRGKIRYRVVDSRGPSHIAFAPFYLLAALGQLLMARLTQPSVVAHINVAGRGSTIRKLMIFLLNRTIGLPYILHLHDYDYADDFNRRGRIAKSLIRKMFQRATCVVVLGRRDRDIALRLLGLRDDRVITLNNAVPDPGPARLRPARPDEPCHLLFLGRLSARKGVPDLLDALAKPSLRDLDWRLTLAGDGPLEDYRRVAGDLGLLDRLKFTGWLGEAEIGALCSEGDVLVLPSYAEGLAMSVLEGLAHGLAVITTPVGAHCEVIEPEVSGILVPVGDETALAESLVRVISDAALRRRLADGARRRFLEKFEVGGYAARLDRIHTTLLLKRRERMGALATDETP